MSGITVNYHTTDYRQLGLNIKKVPDQDSLNGTFFIQIGRGLKGGGRDFITDLVDR